LFPIFRVQSRSDDHEDFSFSRRWPVTYKPPRRHGRRLRALVLGLRCSDLHVVSSYGIATTRRNHFVNLWQWSQSMEGWRQWQSSGEAMHRWITSQCTSDASGRAPTRVVNSGEAPGAIGTAWVVVYCCGGDGRPMIGLGWGKLIMEVAGAAIYMGFCPLSCTTRSRSHIYLQSNFISFFGWDSEWSLWRTRWWGNFLSVSSFLNLGGRKHRS
jgi:hypothetical protein